MGGVQQDVAEVIVWMPKGTVSECEDILARLAGVPKVVEQTMALLDSGLKAGITPPKATLTEVPQQVLNQILDDAKAAPILKFLEEQPSTIDDADWERIGNDATAIYVEKIRPAFRSLHDYLVNTYLPGCRESVAWSDLPNGTEWYAFRVRRYTTTDMKPDEIFELGHSEVKRIRGLMDEIITGTGFEGDFEAFCEFLRTDSQFFFTEAEDLLKEYRDISKRVDPELISLFGHLPRLPYGVIPVPSYADLMFRM